MKGICIWLLAVLAGGVVFLGYSLFPVTALTPELSEQAAVIVGLRPVTDVFPGLWRRIAELMPMTPGALGLVGRGTAGLFAALAFLALRNAFALLFHPASTSEPLSRRLGALLSFLCAVSMAFSDPVWRVFSLFSPAALSLLALTACIVLGQAWLFSPHPWQPALLCLLLGLLMAETPLAVVVGIGILVAFRWTMVRYLETESVTKEEFVRIAELPAWRMLLLGLAGLALGIWSNVSCALAHDGASALGWNFSIVLFHYARSYLGLFLTAATPVGWMLGLVLTVVPLAATCALFSRLTDEQRFIPFEFGTIILLLGLVAYFQQGPVPGVWFWTWIGDCTLVRSPLLLAAFVICSSTAVAFVAGIFAFDAFAEGRSREAPVIEGVYRAGLFLVVVVSVVGVFPQLPHVTYRDLLAFNDGVVRETVRELNGARWLFTDGTCDAALELEAYRRGGELYAINLMAGSGTVETRLRLRGVKNEADRHSAELGAPVLLRMWACDRTNGLSNSALQLGFEVWKRERDLKTLNVSALVARTEGLREEDVSGANEIAARLADRALCLASGAGEPSVPPSVRDAFFRHIWRISRLSRYRRNVALADRLDACNAALQKMLHDVDGDRVRIFMRMTPREGLEIALRRTDFIGASRYAAEVLKINENDPQANFAMGMYYLLGRRYIQAEPYMRKVLEINPNEVAALNNLSILCRRTGRYDEALRLAEAALKILPDDEDVRETYREARAVWYNMQNYD